MSSEKIVGKVLASYYGKTLIETEGNKYYILKGHNHVGDVIEVEVKKALIMPSFMFAMAAMNEEDFDDTMSFIKDKWFAGFNS